MTRHPVRPLILALTLSASLGTITGCNGSSPEPILPTGPPPSAAFTLDSTAVVGDTIRPVNLSSEATRFEWLVRPGYLNSIDRDPIFVMRSEGTYSIRLIAVGIGGFDTVEKTLLLIP